ncbi:beta-phosphoglucomutase family hydrolase [Pseudarthrobacter oxydans]|uniref:Beta-phosphoglucomutase family hydrolase n=1 Tax=Pseudarthrobacter oxydans TaxID=1671 RepID=A0AAW8NBL8_PSEOX|nr:HAD-IA family hydrolase [Pseudarthrobacter oxydans]MDR6793191.1 beta-phosphoglucomutase family hydrolase [Pseudarthrobacter oxydans]MDR7164280.1 beta-phosphoglucomutase family hydrolase [Pseudarthrobacter oxydans]
MTAPSPTAAAARPPFDAVIFDLDGVVTNTALVHQAAWREAFEQILQDPRVPDTADRSPLSKADYRTYIDGLPREEGVVKFLASRGVKVDKGSDGDEPGTWTAFGLGALKNRLFQERLRRDGVQSYPGTVQLLQRLSDARVPTGVVTSSRNASSVLDAAGIPNLFGVILDGTAAANLGLRGKPAPDVFLAAAFRLGVSPSHSVVIEDSEAGVLAAHRGGFGLVVGIDRSGTRRELEAAGAGTVLNDVRELDLGLVLGDPWQLVYEGFDAGHEGHREALTTLGNGYLAVRGASPEGGGSIRYAGMYLAGVFNRLAAEVAGEVLVEEHMVNAPDCLPLDLRLADGQWWSEGGLAVVRERRTLDLQRAVLERRLLLEAGDKRRMEVVQTRFVSMAEPHLLGLETKVTPLGWSGAVEVRSGVTTGVTNSNVPEPAASPRVHLVDRTMDGGSFRQPAPDDVSVVEAETTQSLIRVAVAFRTSVSGGAGAGGAGSRGSGSGGTGAGKPGSIGPFHFRIFEVALADGAAARISKTVAVATSRDRAIASPAAAAVAVLARAGGDIDALLTAHQDAWRHELHPFLVDIEAPVQVRLVLNLHIFHLLQTLTRHTAELDAGVTARGLHGEGYRGHVFWDELFVLPLLTTRTPDVARSLIEYRWRRLPAARHAAAVQGFSGAQFPWQSGSDGTEETPKWLYNDRSGRWVKDHSHMQLHSGLAVAFNVWQYFQATSDKAWLLRKGAELVIDVARFFASRAGFSQDTGRYHIRGVVGPDEYHTGYPGSTDPGLDDNAYTNAMAAWVCLRAAEITGIFHGNELAGLMERLHITDEEAAGWEQVGKAMFIPFHTDGVISQFAGYEDLEELDWERYRESYDSIERLDLILEAEGDQTNRYKLAKQADVLMLPYLLGHEGVIALLQELGYVFTRDLLNRTIEYYLARTAHGSTLSRVAHASVLAALDADRAWDSFREALDADLDDTQHGTTRTGIHLGAMAGSIDVIQRSFAGLRLSGDALVFAPNLPTGLRSVAFMVRYRGHYLNVELKDGRMRIASAAGDAEPISVRVNGRKTALAAGQVRTFRLPTQVEGPAAS